MMDREILDKYIHLESSCLTKWEKQKLRNLIYKYKDAFSLREEMGICPNIKVEIDDTGSSPFFIRPFYAREEDKAILDKEMKRLCYLEILKEGFSAYSSPVTLPISSIMYGFSVTELIFISYWTSLCSQTWLLLLVCLGKCFSLQLGILISLMILLLQ